VFTGSNGQYLFTAPGQSLVGKSVLIYTTGDTITGGAGMEYTGSGTGIDLFGNALTAYGSESNPASVTTFIDAVGSLTDPDIPFTVGSIMPPPGVAFFLPAANFLNLNDDIITTGADIILDGTTTLTGSA